MNPEISVVIPTLNEESCIGTTLAVLARVSQPLEIIVADGGSSDDTTRIAKLAGAAVIEAARGRGSQLRAGAAVARGNVLWFLHADTIVPETAPGAMSAALNEPDVAGGNFCLRFDGSSRGARRLTGIYPHLRKLGLCYGDSGIFVRRSVYEQLGGFQSYPLFEDLDLVRRMRQIGRFVHVDCTLTTSSRRFENRNFEAMFAHWTALQVLFWLGVSPQTLNRWYAPIRGNGRTNV